MDRWTTSRKRRAAAAHIDHELERFLAQAEFADGLCELVPECALEWKPLIEEARAKVHSAAGGTITELRAAVRSAEETLSPLGKTAKSFTIICTGHAHIDMNWMWGWPETVSITCDTFRTGLRLMEEYPDFHFAQSQASCYRIVEEYEPELLEEIQKRVAEGRWEITASHWVENDKNISGHESLCRHLLYTRRYIQETFGLSPEDVPIDWSPDTFGHAVTVPTYLARGAVKYYYCCRPGKAGPERPPLFWWQAPDGSRVLVHRAIAPYNGVLHPRILKHSLEFARRTGIRTWLNVFGVGDHGGGPTHRDLEYGLDMASWPVFPRIEFGTVKRFFETVERHGKSLPTLTCELNFEFPGCYTSESLIKRTNRHAENQLIAAETAAMAAWRAVGRDYPVGRFRSCWQDTIFSHFHDILPGSGVHDTRTFAHAQYQMTTALTDSVETQSLRLIASEVDTTFGEVPPAPSVPPSATRSAIGAGVGFASVDRPIVAAEQSGGQGPRAFVVFNPHPTPWSGVVEATIWDNDPSRGMCGPDPNASVELSATPFYCIGPDGTRMKVESTGQGRYWSHEYVNVAFPVVDLPPLGYATYAIFEGEQTEPAPMVKWFGRFGMENDHFSIDIDPATGGLRSLIDGASGLELVDPGRPACVLEYGVEQPHGMSAWRMEATSAREPLTVKSIRRVLWGPYRATVEVKLARGGSSFTLTYRVDAGDPVLHVDIDGKWVEIGSLEVGVPQLRAAFPLAAESVAGTYEIPFGSIRREFTEGEEVPAIRWAAATGRIGDNEGGLLLLNDSKHGHSITGSTLALTLIRSSYDPDVLPEIGQHRVRLGLRPFSGQLDNASAISDAAALNSPMRVVGTTLHGGRLPASASICTLEPETAVLCALKKAEDSDALVARVYDVSGQDAEVVIEFNPTLAGRPTDVAEVDLLERPVAGSTALVEGHKVRFQLPANGICSVAVTFA